MLTKLTWSHSEIISCADLLKITVKYQSVIFPCFRRQSVPESYEGMRGMKAAVADSHVACLD